MAIEQSKTKPHGLMKFGFTQNAWEEYFAQTHKHAAEENEYAWQWEEEQGHIGKWYVEQVREHAKVRQQEHHK